MFYFVSYLSVIVNFMAISRINFGFYFVAGVIQPIGNFVNPLAIFAYRVLITAYVVESFLYTLNQGVDQRKYLK